VGANYNWWLEMKIPITDLTNPQLDEWCARAQGLERLEDTDRGDVFLNTFNWWYKGARKYRREEYSPTTNDAQAMGLADAFGLIVTHHAKRAWAPNYKGGIQSGETTRIAICRAVIASVFGEYVEIEENQ